MHRDETITFGACCPVKSILLPNESEQEYDALWTTWLDLYHPTEAAELELVRHIVNNNWRCRRSERRLDEVEHALHSEQSHAAQWSAGQNRLLHTWQRFKTADENAFHRSRQAVESLRRSELQLRKFQHSLTEHLFANQALPKEQRQYKQTIRKLVEARIELPERHNDGGCACPPCQREWAIRELKSTQEKNK